MTLLSKPLSVIVVGGGVSGLTVAVEAAESGAEVLLVESQLHLGGRVMRLHQYFPKLHSPTVGLEMHLRRIKANPRITVLTGADVLSIGGTRGNFDVQIALQPMYVKDNCTACGKCAEACPVERDDHFNYAMNKTKAAYALPPNSGATAYAIDAETCAGKDCGRCVEVCADKAIDLENAERKISVKAGSVVLATGWEPYDAAKIDHLGFGRVPNVISNVMMERLVAADGPTGGKILRPSDSAEAKNIVFVQCAGSRTTEHLPYCSSVCCLVSLKQATYVRRAYPDAQVTVVYSEITNPCPGRYDKFLATVIDDERIKYLKGKVVNIREEGKGIVVSVRDAGNAEREIMADMAVLATGVVPSILSHDLKDVLVLDKHGFMSPEFQKEGIYVTGMAKMPYDVTSSMLDATGTALRTIQRIRQS